MATPLITVIIPLYNTAKYVERCVHSVYASGLSSDQMEVIVINDGSTDNGENVVKTLQQSYPLLQLISQENQGLSGARNTGIDHATGEYLFFVDSDDYVDAAALATLIKTAPTADLITFRALKIHSNGTSTSIDRHTKVPAERYAAERYQMTIWCYLFRRSVINNNGLRFLDRSTSEDILFITLYLLLKPELTVLIHPHTVYLYCHRENSITTNAALQARYKLISDRYVVLELLSKQFSTEELLRIDKRFRFFTLEVLLLCIAHSLPYDKYKECITILRALGFYPFPKRPYGLKYRVFTLFANHLPLLYACRKALKFFIRL